MTFVEFAKKHGMTNKGLHEAFQTALYIDGVFVKELEELWRKQREQEKFTPGPFTLKTKI